MKIKNLLIVLLFFSGLGAQMPQQPALAPLPFPQGYPLVYAVPISSQALPDMQFPIHGAISDDGIHFMLSDSAGRGFLGENNPLNAFDVRVRSLVPFASAAVENICFDMQNNRVGAIVTNLGEDGHLDIVIKDVADGRNASARSLVASNDYYPDMISSELVLMDDFIVYFQENDLFVGSLCRGNLRQTVVESIIPVDSGAINCLHVVNERQLLVIGEKTIVLFDVVSKNSVFAVSLDGFDYPGDGIDRVFIDAEYLRDGRLIVSTNVDIGMFFYNSNENHWKRLSTLCQHRGTASLKLRKRYNGDMVFAFGRRHLIMDYDCLNIWFNTWPFGASGALPSLNYMSFIFDSQMTILDVSCALDGSLILLCVVDQQVYLLKIVLDRFNSYVDGVLKREIYGRPFRLQQHFGHSGVIADVYQGRSFWLKVSQNEDQFAEIDLQRYQRGRELDDIFIEVINAEYGSRGTHYGPDEEYDEAASPPSLDDY